MTTAVDYDNDPLTYSLTISVNCTGGSTDGSYPLGNNPVQYFAHDDNCVLPGSEGPTFGVIVNDGQGGTDTPQGLTEFND